MPRTPSFAHVFHLIRELRRAAIENQENAAQRDEGSFHLCLGAALASDAADALEALAAQSFADDPTVQRRRARRSRAWRRCGRAAGPNDPDSRKRLI